MQEIIFDVIDSTNTYLKKNYQQYNHLTFVSATTQTDGRGRNGRSWYSSNNNLTFSFLLKENLEHYKELSVLTAYTIIKVLENYNISNLSIKWPNDIYVNDSKICGILLEAVSTNSLQCLVIGVGLNVNQIDFDEDYLHTPTSMALELHQTINLNELKEKIYYSLNEMVDNLEYDYYPLVSKYDYLKNKECYAIINNQKEKIKVIGIDQDYSLKINFNNNIQNIETDEISFHM